MEHLRDKAVYLKMAEENAMPNETSKNASKDAQPEALATFAATARNKGVKPPIRGVGDRRDSRQAG